jgi:hypothetical protein
MSTLRYGKIPLFLDMDGVFANFSKKVLELTGGLEYESTPEFWAKYLDHHPLFSMLEKMPDADHLWEGILSYSGYLDIQILTAVPVFTTRVYTHWESQKIEWMYRMFVKSLDIPINIGPYACDKWKHCRSEHSLLLDDSERNCEDWETKAKGKAILYTGDSTKALIQIVDHIKEWT